MPVFDYLARDNRDAPREGRVEADSAQGAHRKLTLQGLKVVRLTPTTRAEPREPVVEAPPRGFPWVAAGLVVGSLVAGGGFLWYRGQSTPPPQPRQAQVGTFKTPAAPPEPEPEPTNPLATPTAYVPPLEQPGKVRRTSSGRYEAAKSSTVEAAMMKRTHAGQAPSDDKPRLEPVDPQPGGDLDDLVKD